MGRRLKGNSRQPIATADVKRTGGSRTRSTNSGAIATVGRPGTSARTTPVTTSRIGDGIFDRAATIATPAITASRNTSAWIVGIIGFPSLPPDNHCGSVETQDHLDKMIEYGCVE